MQGKENGDTETNHLIQHMIPPATTKLDNVKRTAHMCDNNDLPALYTGKKKNL